MARMLVVGLVALLSSGAIGASVLAFSKNHKRPPTEAAVDGERVRLEDEVRALKREVVELRAAARTALELAPARPSSRDLIEPLVRRTDEHPNDPERIRTENDATLAALASKMRVQPRDPVWSKSTEEWMSEGFRSQATPGTKVVSVECRTTLCCVTFGHDDKLAQRAVPHIVAQTLPYSAEMVYAYTNEGDAATMVYISREGRHLVERAAND
jgi:hypothetical protein